MKYVECYLPDINFKISTTDENYEMVKNKIDESVIKYKKNCEKTIEIEYIVDKLKFEELNKMIKKEDGKIYDSFKKQKHKEVYLNEQYYYLVDTEEYIGVKLNDLNYKIIVEENNSTAANWIVRIIRELYLREKEDKKFFFMHGTGLEINGKGLLLLGTSGSGKTTLAVKMMEIDGKKGFLSNDRVLLDENMTMDYFPHAVTYAMGTVKNNKKLDKYFKENKILEKKKKIKYENAENDVDCNTPLTDVEKIFDSTYMTARTELNTIIYPRFDKEFEDVEIINMTNEEKIALLEETNFTPNDTESLRKPWLRKRNIDTEELLEIRKNLINEIIKKVNIKKIRYGVKTKAEDILKSL